MLSAVILARDEEDRIADCVRAVAFADEVLVLDSGSTDRTVALAEASGARVIRTDWPGYVAQKNRALAEARGDWILSVDADEIVDLTLATAIIEVTREGRPPAAYALTRREVWLGHALRGGHWRPRPHARLVHRELVAQGHARWTGEDPHDRLTTDLRAAVLAGHLVHTPYRDLGEHFRTIDRYTALQARDAGVVTAGFRALWHFVSGYLLRAGWRDGAPGLVVALLGGLHTFLKWSRKGFDPSARASA